MLRAATILTTMMTQRNKRRHTASVVLSETIKLDTMEFNAMLLQDVVDRTGLDGSMIVVSTMVWLLMD